MNKKTWTLRVFLNVAFKPFVFEVFDHIQDGEQCENKFVFVPDDSKKAVVPKREQLEECIYYKINREHMADFI